MLLKKKITEKTFKKERLDLSRLRAFGVIPEVFDIVVAVFFLVDGDAGRVLGAELLDGPRVAVLGHASADVRASLLRQITRLRWTSS